MSVVVAAVVIIVADDVEINKRRKPQPKSGQIPVPAKIIPLI